MLKSQNKRNPLIDYCKFMSSLMIVAIHTELFQDINGNLYFAFVHVICRLAVPFFALTTGYFTAKAIDDTIGKRKGILQWWKIAKLYILWSFVYFAFIYPNYCQDGLITLIKWYSIDTIAHGSHYHLWYILSLLVGLPIFQFVWGRIGYKKLAIFAILLYLFYIYTYAYHVIWPLEPYTYQILSFFGVIPAIYTGVFLIFPYLILGGCVNRMQNTKNLSSLGCHYLFPFFLICQFLEALVLRNNYVNQWSYIFFSLPTAICFFIWIIIQNRNNKPSKQIILSHLGEMSIVIYCIHPLIIESIGKNISSSIYLFFITTLLSSICSFAYCVLKNATKRLG